MESDDFTEVTLLSALELVLPPLPTVTFFFYVYPGTCGTIIDQSNADFTFPTAELCKK